MPSMPILALATVGPLTAVTVPFAELHDTLSESADGNGVQATKSFLVRWTDRIQFYKDVMGHVTITGGVGGTVTRLIPLQYPDMPRLYAVSLHMEPWGQSSDGPYQIRYEWAKVDVGFATVPWNFQGPDDPDNFTPEVYRTESLEMGGEVMQNPGQAYEFVSSSQKIKQPQSRIIPTANLSIKIHQAPYIPFDAIFALIGAVNNGEFYGAPAGTVLFMGGQSEAETNVALFRTQSLTLKFSYRSVPWSVALLPDGSGYDIVRLKGTIPTPPYPLTSKQYLYPEGDFSPLFV
jgi:hypothetical protein